MKRLFSRVLGATAGAMALHFFLVLDHLPVQLVGQYIDRRVHIFMYGVGKDIGAVDMHGGFRLLPHLLNAENDMHIGHIVEMTLETLELVVDIVLQGISNVHMMTGQANLHNYLLCLDE